MREDEKSMTEKELKKLSRMDLLEMLIDQSTEFQALEKKLLAAEDALRQRELTIHTAGSIAEASLQLNGVFEAAQAASQQYLDNIRLRSQRQEAACRQLEKESQERADLQLAEMKKKCAAMEAETKVKCDEMIAKAKAEAKVKCDEMIAKAKAEAQLYWDQAAKKLENYYAEHPGIRELLPIAFPKQEQE